MALRDYLADRAYVLAIGIACCAGVACMLLVTGAGVQAAVAAVGFMLTCGAASLSISFLRRRKFYNDLALLVKDLDSAYQAPSLIEEPAFLEGRLAYGALEAMGKSAADEVAQNREQADAYREYIELWIHEVKTPIAAAGLIAAGMHGRQAAKLKGELNRIEGYVEQALYYARSTSLEKDFSIRELHLADTVRGVCRKNARYLIEQGVTPTVDIPDACTVFADGKWLAFVVGQVVANAAKYGASQVRFSVREEGEGTAAATVLEVADDGCGIPAADVPRVFDRGFTGQNGRAQGSSTGMGLYLAAVMCKKMGLGLAIASEEGTGTRVMVSFPHDRRRRDIQG